MFTRRSAQPSSGFHDSSTPLPLFLRLQRIIDAKYGCGSLYYTHKIGLTSGRIGLIPQGSGARKADGDNLVSAFNLCQGQWYVANW